MDVGKVCIQSFAPHGVKFLAPQTQGGEGGAVILEIPAGFVKDNFVIADVSTVESLATDPTFKALIDAKMIRVLDKVPEKYADPVLEVQKIRANLVSAVEQKNAATTKNSALEAENAVLKAELAALKNGGKVQ